MKPWPRNPLTNDGNNDKTGKKRQRTNGSDASETEQKYIDPGK